MILAMDIMILGMAQVGTMGTTIMIIPATTHGAVDTITVDPTTGAGVIGMDTVMATATAAGITVAVADTTAAADITIENNLP
jgi:hypothetical protein